MSTHDLLRANCEKLWNLYRTNLEDLKALQSTLIDDILPHLALELELDGDDVAWAKEWLQDTRSMFHLMRRHSFTRSFAMESIRKTLVWRIQHLKPILNHTRVELAENHPPLARCLPPTVHDPSGRPLVIVRVVDFEWADPVESDNLKARVLAQLEDLRKHLASLDTQVTLASDDTTQDEPGHWECRPALQYIILLDLADLSVQKISLDMFSWFVRDVIPRFPGMLAAVFVLNYTWTHSGIWGLVKRILPRQALSRVFFVDQKELRRFFTEEHLPAEYGGLTPLALLEDPVASGSATPCPEPESSPQNSSSMAHANGASSPDSLQGTSLIPDQRHIASTSFLNPFFGYPVLLSPTSASLPSYPYSYPSNTPYTSSLHSKDTWQSHLRHGRRRKRDLAKTLLNLFWLRWRTGIKKLATALLFLGCCFLVAKKSWVGRVVQRKLRATRARHFLGFMR